MERRGEESRWDLIQSVSSRWYHQAGTPELTVERQWDPNAGRMTLQLRQATAPTPGQVDKQPLVLPLAMALIGSRGASRRRATRSNGERN